MTDEEKFIDWLCTITKNNTDYELTKASTDKIGIIQRPNAVRGALPILVIKVTKYD